MSSGRAAVAAVVAVALMGALLTVPGVGAANPPPTYVGSVGINTHDVWLSEAATYAEFQQLAAGGVTQVRDQFPWTHLETSRGRFDWSRSDNLMSAASRAGVDVLGILAYTAPWANATGNTRQPPSDPQDFANFATAVLDRYGPGGTFWSSRRDLSPRPLRAVELWNEAWGWWNWYPEVNPAQYATLARTAASAIQARHPDVTIVMDADVLQVRRDGQIRGWIDEVLRAEPRLIDLIDVFGAHPYPDPRNQSPLDRNGDARWDFRQVELIRQTTLALGADKPIWITEIGWSTAPGVSDAVSESTQATFVADALRQAFEWPYVQRVYVYSYDRDNGVSGDREGWFGLRHQDGTPKPAFAAMTQFANSARPRSEPTRSHPNGRRLAVPFDAAADEPATEPEGAAGPSHDPSVAGGRPEDDDATGGASSGGGASGGGASGGGQDAPSGGTGEGPTGPASTADWSTVSAFARRFVEAVCHPVM